MAPRPALNRLLTRPRLSDWDDDELITFAEAVALLFPNGPISTAGLHVAKRRGELASVSICRMSYTSIRSINQMILQKRAL